MPHICNSTFNAQPMVYEIKIFGHLGTQWAEWFGDLTVTQNENGTTLLAGVVADQAALHGILKKIRDLGMPLLLVNCVNFDRQDGLETDDFSVSKFRKNTAL